jgi:type IV/VI secretion system ImpK/VasF family protein
MRLLELAEPLFQYICLLNRISRQGAPSNDYDRERVRTQVNSFLEKMREQARDDLRLQNQLRQIELPLVFFADWMLVNSQFEFGGEEGEWNRNRLAKDNKEEAGDEKFFDLLDDTLKAAATTASSPEACERLAVFYVCLGLGFQGKLMYEDARARSNKLNEYMRKIVSFIPNIVDKNLDWKITPESERPDERNLIEPPSKKMVFLVLGFVCFTLATFYSYYKQFNLASTVVDEATDAIVKAEQQYLKAHPQH